MIESLEGLRQLIPREQAVRLLNGAILFVAGLVLARFAAAATRRLLGDRATQQQRILVRRAVVYSIVVLFTLAAMHAAGFNLSVLLGAAGILTVALGFASQTAVSNVISGLFLLGEKAFAVGDTIRIDDLTGEILSIDLLSVKVRTFDNLYVRLPNETLLKSRITNLSRFPIRRLDIPIGVAYRHDVAEVTRVLIAVADENPLVLDEPRPTVFHLGFADSALSLQFSVWLKRENLIALRDRINQEIKAAFDREGIEIPFPQRTLSVLDGPLAVRLDRSAAADDGDASDAVPSGS